MSVHIRKSIVFTALFAAGELTGCGGGGNSQTSAATVTSACPATSYTSDACNYPITPSMASGSSSLFSTSTQYYTGSVTATCTNGILSYSTPTCKPPAAPAVSLTANPNTSLPEGGGNVTLTSIVKGATSCTASNNGNNTSWLGSYATEGNDSTSVTVPTTTTFTLTCYNGVNIPASSTSVSNTVTVAEGLGYYQPIITTIAGNGLTPFTANNGVIEGSPYFNFSTYPLNTGISAVTALGWQVSQVWYDTDEASFYTVAVSPADNKIHVLEVSFENSVNALWSFPDVNLPIWFVDRGLAPVTWGPTWNVNCTSDDKAGVCQGRIMSESGAYSYFTYNPAPTP